MCWRKVTTLCAYSIIIYFSVINNFYLNFWCYCCRALWLQFFGIYIEYLVNNHLWWFFFCSSVSKYKLWRYRTWIGRSIDDFNVFNPTTHIRLSLLQHNLPIIPIFCFSLCFLSPYTKTMWLTDTCISFPFCNAFFLCFRALRYSISHLLYATCLCWFIYHPRLIISGKPLSTYLVRIFSCRCQALI